MTRSHFGDIKVGDKIRWVQKFSRNQEVSTVERLTSTRAICSDGKSFRLDTGLLIGSGTGWDRRHGYLVTDEELAEIELESRIREAQAEIRALKVTANNLTEVEVLLQKASQP